MTADNMEFDEISFNEFDGKLSIPEDSNRATGKRTAASMSITSDVRSVATGTTGGDNQAIIAICESRGNLSEVGIAVFITERNVCLVQQFSDSSTYARTMSLFSLHPPLRVLICTNTNECNKSKLFQTIVDTFPLDSIVFMNRSDFNEDKGLKYIQTLGTEKCLQSVLFACDKKYYAFSATSALFSYLEQQVSVTFHRKSILFETKSIQGPVFIDYHSAKALELVCCNGDSKGACNLFQAVCKCQTSMGKRLLRTNILQPLSDLEQITGRQNAIQDLLSNETHKLRLQEELAKIPDIDNSIGMLIRYMPSMDTKSGDAMIHQALQLKHIVYKSKVIATTLEGLQSSELFFKLSQKIDCAELDDLISMIDSFLNEDISYSDKATIQHHQRFFAVKSGSDSLLEVARRTLKETQNDIYEYVSAWSQQADLHIDIKYQAKRGYYLSISKASLGGRSIESICSNYREGRNEVTFTTIDLIKLNARIKESMTEILLASQQALEMLFQCARGKIDVLYSLSEAIAECDFLCGIAEWTKEIGGVRPEFGDSLAVRNGRHPVLEASENPRNIVPNDYFSCSGNSFTVVTGTNMSGKSTNSKQLILLSILAQIGTFIPADYASFPIYDRFLTRLGSDDELESNASSFKMEMREAAYILDSITDRSLVVIDEIGRGTGYTEGMSIALAICDEILKTDATVLFVTHFPQLIEYLKYHPKVSLIQLQTQLSDITNELRFMYRATSGVVSMANYGIKMAELVGLDSTLIATAHRTVQLLEASEGRGIEHSGVRNALQKRRLILQTAEKVLKIKSMSSIDDETRQLQLRQLLLTLTEGNEESN